MRAYNPLGLEPDIVSDTAPTSSPIGKPATVAAPLPPGDHPLEVAARQGFGPLSAKAQSVWHGQAMPCVTCGALVHREDLACEHCEQDLSEEMIAKMRQHAGPWYVLEHVRPFPGVSLELIIRQIQRGLITETSIIRGPATDYQWRFAVETPGLCRYFLRCWKCHESVTPTAAYCENCLSGLLMEPPKAEAKPAPRATPVAGGPAAAAVAATGTGSREAADPASSVPKQTIRDSLSELTAALDQTDAIRREDLWDETPRVGGIRATWIAIILLILTVLVLIWIASSRTTSPVGKTSLEGSSFNTSSEFS